MFAKVRDVSVKTRPTCGRSAVTLVELLVVIAITAALVGLLIPAVQMARESARKASCASNLRQLGLGILQHEEMHKIYPTGGWGDSWVGDPDAGFGMSQPGGWVYNILPFIEQSSLRELGKGLDKNQKPAVLVQLMESPIAILQCPSRRPSQLYAYNGPKQFNNSVPPLDVAKTDYAINGIISSIKSRISLQDIQLHGRGTTNTVMAGEKSLLPEHYLTGQGDGDTLVAYVGHGDDIQRQASSPASEDHAGIIGFGGPHPGGANIAHCDGSLRFAAGDETLEP